MLRREIFSTAYFFLLGWDGPIRDMMKR